MHAGSRCPRPFSADMSTPPSTPVTEPRSAPSPWLTMMVPIAIYLLGTAVQWGTQGADARNLERRVTVVEAEQARQGSAQSKADTQSARLEARLDARFDAVSADIARLTRAVERFTDGRSATARDLR